MYEFMLINYIMGFFCSLFDTHPEFRKYFKGHENFTGADVKKSDHFKKQGMIKISK